MPKPFVAGAMGELETRILLEQYVSAELAEALGPKLKGADYRVDETKPGHRMTLVYASEWTDGMPLPDISRPIRKFCAESGKAWK